MYRKEKREEEKRTGREDGEVKERERNAGCGFGSSSSVLEQRNTIYTQ